MNPLFKAIFLGLLNYLVYSYIILPLSTPSLEEQQEGGLAGEGDKAVWQEEDLFWFIQISDLHISRYVYPDLQEDLKEFLTTTIDSVRPGAVVVSGDLTDAKEEGGVGSRQQAAEWRAYRDLVRETGIANKTVYMDIRGNHDTFDVSDYADPMNLYSSHSKMGPSHQSSYITTVGHHGKTISFVAMDASLNPGPKKVFNFLGQLTEGHLERLHQLKAEAEQSDYQIYFGHFPLSCIVPSTAAKASVSGGLAYLSGHLHTLGGLAPRMHALHRSGTPELELGDWKENRMWRLLAIDNGLLSFKDQRHGPASWPVVLITNPKDAARVAPRVEPLGRVLASHAVRVLVFGQAEGPVVTAVQAKVDKEDWKDLMPGPEPGVWTVPWEPQDYAGSRHTLTVRVDMMDDFGDASSKEVTQRFVVDLAGLGEPEYSLYARILLMADVYTALQSAWLLACLLCLLPPAMARLAPERLAELLPREAVLRLRLFASDNFLFYMYTLTGLWVTAGPWHVGQILTGHIGFIFPWGTVVRGAVMPSFYPYIFSIVHLAAFHTPLLWSLLFKMEVRRAQEEDTKTALAVSNIPVTLVLSMQACMLLLLYLFPSRLGIFKEIALLLAPVEIATIIIGFSLNGVVSFKIRNRRF